MVVLGVQWRQGCEGADERGGADVAERAEGAGPAFARAPVLARAPVADAVLLPGRQLRQSQVRRAHPHPAAFVTPRRRRCRGAAQRLPGSFRLEGKMVDAWRKPRRCRCRAAAQCLLNSFAVPLGQTVEEEVCANLGRLANELTN